MSMPHVHAFLRSEQGAVTADWAVLGAATFALGLAVTTVVAGGLARVSGDIRDLLLGIEISAGFRDAVAQICHAAGLEPGPTAGETGATYDGNPVHAMLIYQADDFVGGLPRERGARAEGGQAQTITLKDDKTPVLMLIADDDDQLHEVDNGAQVLARDIELNGVTYRAGYDVSAAYTLSDPMGELTVSSLHFGENFSGHGQGQVFATTASRPLEPGQSYSFSENVTSHRNELSFSAYLGC